MSSLLCRKLDKYTPGNKVSRDIPRVHFVGNLPPGVGKNYCGRECMGSSLKKPQPKTKKGGTPMKGEVFIKTVKCLLIFFRGRKKEMPPSWLIILITMRTQNSQAKRVSAGFGYSHVMVGNTTVYTTKIRTKQFDLLRYAIEQYKRNENKLQGTYGLIKLNKNRQNYVTYEFVTTDLKAMNQFRREMDQARAEVLDVQALRLKMQNPHYEPIWMSAIREQLYREESPAWQSDDLPF